MLSHHVNLEVTTWPSVPVCDARHNKERWVFIVPITEALQTVTSLAEIAY